MPRGGGIGCAARFWRVFPLLALYCAAFLLPSIILCLIVVRAKKWTAASAFLASHLAAVKLITALTMILLIAAAWLA